MPKTIGGTDGNHLKPDKHPFEITTRARPIRQPLARTVGVTPPPGGAGNKISANSEMRKKRPLNGPGDAK